MKIIHSKQALIGGKWLLDVQVNISDDGRIAQIGDQTQTATDKVAILLPAPLNLHSHTFQRAMAGLTEARGPDPRDSFWSWRQLMYRFLDQLTPDHVEAIASLAFMEMAEAGYGSVAEFHYLHHDVAGKTYGNLAEMSDRIVAAAENAGIGLTLLPVLYQYGGCDLRPLAGGQMRFDNEPAQFMRLHDGAAKSVRSAAADFNIGVAPHSLRAVDENGLAQILDFAKSGPIHMHLAEQVAEVDELVAHRNARPTEWLLANHDVNDRWCLIHATQLNDQETHDLAKSGAVAGLCPITESNLGDGIFRGTEFLDHGGVVGFGSDSDVHISLFDELKTLEYSQRLRDKSRAALATPAKSTGRVLIDAANKGGAQAGGRDAGEIAVGKWADMIGLDDDNQWLCNRKGDALLDSMIFGGWGQACITDVWSAGRHLVKEGRHFARETIIKDYKTAMQQLETAI